MKVRVGILLLILTSLTACGTTGKQATYHTSDSTIASVESTYSPSSGYVGILTNLTKWHWYRLPAEDRMKQEQAIFFALNMLENGQESSWYNNKTGTNGKVVVLSTYPMGSGYCRTIASTLHYKGKVRNFKEDACNANSNNDKISGTGHIFKGDDVTDFTFDGNLQVNVKQIQFDREKTQDYYKFSVSISLEFIEKKSALDIKTYNVNSNEYGEIVGSFAIKDQDNLDINLMHKSLESISLKLRAIN